MWFVLLLLWVTLCPSGSRRGHRPTAPPDGRVGTGDDGGVGGGIYGFLSFPFRLESPPAGTRITRHGRDGACLERGRADRRAPSFGGGGDEEPLNPSKRQLEMGVQQKESGTPFVRKGVVSTNTEVDTPLLHTEGGRRSSPPRL